MQITIRTTTLNHNIQILKQLREHNDKISTAKRIEVNLNEYHYITPFSMLVIGSTIRQWKRIGKNVKTIYADHQSIGYLEHLGFFDLIDEKTEKKINETPSNDLCVPLRKITREELNQSRVNNEVGAIEKKAIEISKRITDNYYNQKHFTYLITEMVRNSFEHANVDEVFLVAQHWHHSNLLEIAIMDEGIGIKETLKSHVKKLNPQKSKWDDFDYLEYALKPGITAGSNFSYADEDTKNSGYGLYIAQEICKKYKQGFIITSDNWCQLSTSYKPKKTYFPVTKGVILQLRLDTKNMKNFEKIRREIIKEGTLKYEKKYKEKSYVSKASSGKY